MADTNRKMTREEMEAEIRACKALLNETDYTVIKSLEGILECTTSTSIVNFIKSVSAEIKEAVEHRIEYRKTINELEEELEKATATQDAGE